MTIPPSPQPEDATGAALTIADAARAAGTDRHAIRRKLHAGAFPNAFKDAQGFWRIYESDMIAADLPLVSRATETAADPVGSALSARPARDETDLLRAEIIELRHRVAKAEALLAAERRLSEEMSRALQTARRTGDALLAQIAGPRVEPPAREPSPAPAQPRVNWQAGLRAARAREAELRAARERDAQQRARTGESGS
jgi:hypothetical protein